MTSFSSLKKSSGDLARLAKEIEKINTPASDKKRGDDRFWQPEVDKAGNGSAVIRFLPPAAVDGDDGLPWVRIFNHGFKGPTGKWYIENSLTTINLKDPVAEYNSKLWNASSDDNSPERKQAREQKRKLSYISNVYVVSDPKNPDNEGKVFLFRYGKKIFDKITALMNPQFEGDTPVNPFDFWNGSNFKLRIRQVEGYRNYDMSTFEGQGKLLQDDEAMEAIWKKQYSLKEFVDPKNFKSYEDLKRRLEEVLDEEGSSGSNEMPRMKPSQPFLADEKPNFAAKKAVVEDDDTPPFSTDDDDEELAAFKKMAL